MGMKYVEAVNVLEGKGSFDSKMKKFIKHKTKRRTDKPSTLELLWYGKHWYRRKRKMSNE